MASNQSTFDNLPGQSIQLIELLDEKIPKAIHTGDTMSVEDRDKLIFQAGQRELVDKLKRAIADKKGKD